MVHAHADSPQEKRMKIWILSVLVFTEDPDLVDFGACYCGLYISDEIIKGEKELQSIPERRPSPEDREKIMEKDTVNIPNKLSSPVYRCNVCGYLCAREKPPEICPICKVSGDRFVRFM